MARRRHDRCGGRWSKFSSEQVEANFVRHFLESLHAAVNAHDAHAVAALCHKNIVWEDPAAPEPLRGREAIYHFHRDVMFRAIPDVRIELVDGPYLSLDGASSAVRLRMSETMTGPLTPPGFAPTGGPIAFETAEFSYFDGGLLSRHAVVLNMLGLARQIGAVPKAGSFAERLVSGSSTLPLAVRGDNGREDAPHQPSRNKCMQPDAAEPRR